MTAPLRTDYSDTLSVSRLEIHCARGDDGIWHAWLYDPAKDEIIATCVQDQWPTLGSTIATGILPILDNY